MIKWLLNPINTTKDSLINLDNAELKTYKPIGKANDAADCHIFGESFNATKRLMGRASAQHY